MNLQLVFEFDSGVATQLQSFEDLKGIPIPDIGDCVCPGQGHFRVKLRTFRYSPKELTVFYQCEQEPDDLVLKRAG